jgi:UDP:flavonoid glycosyltransferase YjiC (YdhE family)
MDGRSGSLGRGVGIRRRILIVATSGGGGDLQPLVALAMGLRERGAQVETFGDASVRTSMARLGVETIVADPELDLARQYAIVAEQTQHLQPELQGERMRERLVGWAERLALSIERAIETEHPDVLVTSLFGSGAVRLAAERYSLPWVAVNSTFYIGPDPPRSPELDFGPRVPLFRDFFAPNVNAATLVLHASDAEFDFGFSALPAHHRYVGPLFWDPPTALPAYLESPGDPWVLVTLSSHAQDDLPIARASLSGLHDLPVRVLLTLGEHVEQDLGPLPSNARLERYASHGPVLERGVLMISHAGHGSVMRALWYGVPMVLVPWGRDQVGVAVRAEQLGVAVVVLRQHLASENLAASARRVLVDRSMAERARAVSRRLQADDPVATACALVATV